MPAKKGNKYAVGNKGGGRPSNYKKEYVDIAYRISLCGLTDAQIANVFDISESTLHMWKHKHQDFFEALKKGKQIADANVAKSLYHRAIGYEHPDIDIRVIRGKIKQTRLIKYYPPDTLAGIFWLKNRQPDLWREKTEVDHGATQAFLDLLKQTSVPKNGNTDDSKESSAE